jgi:hypothetical protein
VVVQISSESNLSRLIQSVKRHKIILHFSGICDAQKSSKDKKEEIREAHPAWQAWSSCGCRSEQTYNNLCRTKMLERMPALHSEAINLEYASSIHCRSLLTLAMVLWRSLMCRSLPFSCLYQDQLKYHDAGSLLYTLNSHAVRTP